MQIDSLIIGPVSLDINIDCHDNERREIGGAVVAAGYATSRTGFDVAVLTKASLPETDIENVYKDCELTLFIAESNTTCSIENKYFDETKETRKCTSLSVCEPICFDEIMSALDEVEPKVFHFAGLVYGDFKEELFKNLSGLGKVAVDVQCLLRHVEDDKSMKFHDWDNKTTYLPYIDYLKTDAAEAECLTGLKDRYEAAKLLYSWGAKEVMITHNTEVIVYDGQHFYACPIKSRNLSGRTGRGDTTFGGYINSRNTKSIEDSLLFATALVSLKMETPGPFKGTKEDVLKYIEEFYANGVEVK